MLCLAYCVGVFELGLFGGEAFFDVGVVAVFDVAVLDAGHLVGVFFWKDLTVLDWLHGGMVVVLVDFSVDGCGGLLVASGCYILVLDGGVDFLGRVRCDR